MYRIFVLVLSFLWVGESYGSFIIKDTLCGGIEIQRLFLDSLIDAGNDSVVITHCPVKSIAPNLQWNFKGFMIDPRDTVLFFDGPDLEAPKLGGATELFGLQQNFTVKSNLENTTGCLTMLYKRDPSSDRDPWSFIPSCFFPCQPFNIKEINNISEDSICPGTELSFEVEGIFGGIQNYLQSDSLVEYVWFINKTEVGRGISLAYNFNEPGGFAINVEGKDSMNCKTEIDQQIAIKVSGPPQFVVGSAVDFEFCQYDTAAFTAYKSNGDILDSAINLIAPQYQFDLAFRNGDTLPIPDADGNRFVSSLQINGFKNTDTLRNEKDLESICVNMEHSYLHDLYIQIECPSGKSAFLQKGKSNNTDPAYLLGKPIDKDDNFPTPGEGLTYCWSYDNNLVVWNDFLIGRPQGETLPSGKYKSLESFENLKGCPLNGDWKLIVTDTFFEDNGFIFEWSLEFAESFYPGRSPFRPDIIAYEWKSPSGTNPADSALRWENFYPNPGQSFFNLSITDDFGCTYDSTFQFSVLPEFHPNCRDCGDLLIGDLTVEYCNNDSIPLNFEGRSSKIDFVTFENFNSDSILISDIKSESLEQICFSGTFDLRGGLMIYVINGNDTISLLDTIGSEDSILINRCIEITNLKYNPEGLWKIALDDPSKGEITSWSLSLTNTFEFVYQWENNPVGLSCTDCPNPTFYPDLIIEDTTRYALNATDNFGCDVESEFTGISIPIYDSLKVDTLMPERGQVLFFWNTSASGLNYEMNWGTGWNQTKDTFHLFQNLLPGTILSFKVRVASTNPACPQYITEINILYNPCDLETELLDIKNPSCFNTNDGSLRVQSKGGVFPMSFRITGQSLGRDSIFSGLGSGLYWVEAIDNLGCIDSIEIELAKPYPIEAEIKILNEISCHDGNDGVIVAEGKGGTGNLSSFWNNQSIKNDTLKGIGSGNYALKIEDSFKCVLDTFYIISGPSSIQINPSFELPSCFGSADGKISINAVGGSGSYEFHWDNGQQKADLENLSSGTYCLTVTDANGCTKDTCFQLLDPIKLRIDSIQITSPKCFGEESGSAEVFVSGGTGFNQFFWNDPFLQINSKATNLSSGEFEVVVTDENMCFDSATAILTDPEEIMIDLTVKNVSCFGLKDGEIETQVTGGSMPYSFSWSSGDIAESLDSLAQGAFIVTVTDSIGCKKQASTIVDSPNSPITATFIQTKEGCYGESGNIAEVNASGGYGGYTFEWSNGKTGALQMDLDTQEYKIIVKDSSGCQIEVVGKPKDFPQLIPNLIVEPPSCLGLSDGKIGINFASFGVKLEDLSFEWSNGKTGPVITNLSGDSTYSVTVTHNNGCEAVISRYLRLPTDILFELRSDPVTCFGGSDGKARIVNLFSEDPNFTFSWDFASGNQTQQEAVGLKSGNYSVTITNGSGCKKSGQVIVGSPTAIRLESFIKNNDCHGDSIGKIELNISGGTGNYFYTWSNGFTGRINEKLTQGNYSVFVKDGNNCELKDSFVITHPDLLDLDAVSEQVSCFGSRDGKVEALPFGGTPPYGYSIDGNSFSNSSVFGGLPSGAYQVWVRDSKGCVSKIESTISSPPKFLVDIGSTNYKIKLGDELELIVSNINGQTPFKFNWISSVEGALNCLDCPSVLVNTPKLTFIEVVVTDSKGCIASDKTTIVVDKNRVIEVPTGFSPNSDGLNDLLLVHGTEGTQILTFKIFDRWGELIFETGDFEVNDPLSGWDGKFRNQDLGPGTYLWQVEAQFIDGIIELYKGTTTLIR